MSAKVSVLIATRVHGFIAREDGSIDFRPYSWVDI